MTDLGPYGSPRNDCEETSNARHAVDADQAERAESIAQHAADELAEMDARMSQLESEIKMIRGTLVSHIKNAAGTRAA